MRRDRLDGDRLDLRADDHRRLADARRRAGGQALDLGSGQGPASTTADRTRTPTRSATTRCSPRRASSCPSAVQTVATIGVYGATLEAFLRALREADVRVLIDVRQRRGVRGSEYAWANSARLQSALGEAGIEYRHHKELAPTTELRQLQYREDAKAGVGKRSRAELSPDIETVTRARSSTGSTSQLSPRACRAKAPRAAVCRARSRSLPPLADCRATGDRARPAGRAPPAGLAVASNHVVQALRAPGPFEVLEPTKTGWVRGWDRCRRWAAAGGICTKVVQTSRIGPDRRPLFPIRDWACVRLVELWLL